MSRNATLRPTLHKDHTVTYWSVRHQQWQRHAASVPAEELAAMNADERARVQRHLGNDAR